MSNTQNKLSSTALRLLATGNGTLQVKLNDSIKELTADQINDWVAENKPSLIGWFPHQEGPYASNWVMVHGFTNLALDSLDRPSVIKDNSTGKVYKVMYEGMTPAYGDEYRQHEITLTGEHGGHKFTVKNLSIRAGACFWVNNHKRF